MEDLKRAIKVILNSGAKYPPTLPELVQSLKYSEVCFYEAYQRFLKGKKGSKAEQYVAQKYGYELRRMNADMAQQRFTQWLKLALDAEHRGDLDKKVKPQRISAHSVKNTNDLARERAQHNGLVEPNNFAIGSVFHRIATMVQGQRVTL
ncbi:TPA: hypothetical protein RQK94_003371 [Vibrio vulnificus]|uniref:hypothetical protein n=1 Tax=Vibrio vulnificus TaxID=672 RepID=UPI001A2547B4|nr:hypothetical protein [Vibrio vulnificus]HAS6272435.1 hypothetical protein [Vibrio vulnificus]HDY7428342.1 hypothetical protein [Vibrio vulnificus]HDY7680242.1 hypothetical protein [Vibrio vulnificus]HDY7754235.1 hypothetical protein [Vibrio vulnificus]